MSASTTRKLGQPFVAQYGRRAVAVRRRWRRMAPARPTVVVVVDRLSMVCPVCCSRSLDSPESWAERPMRSWYPGGLSRERSRALTCGRRCGNESSMNARSDSVNRAVLGRALPMSVVPGPCTRNRLDSHDPSGARWGSGRPEWRWRELDPLGAGGSGVPRGSRRSDLVPGPLQPHHPAPFASPCSCHTTCYKGRTRGLGPARIGRSFAEWCPGGYRRRRNAAPGPLERPSFARCNTCCSKRRRARQRRSARRRDAWMCQTAAARARRREAGDGSPRGRSILRAARHVGPPEPWVTIPR